MICGLHERLRRVKLPGSGGWYDEYGLRRLSFPGSINSGQVKNLPPRGGDEGHGLACGLRFDGVLSVDLPGRDAGMGTWRACVARGMIEA
jgi:hypothetical protein